MSSRVIKTNNGNVKLYDPPFTPEEQAIIERGLYGTPRAIARLTAPKRFQNDPQQALPEEPPACSPD